MGQNKKLPEWNQVGLFYKAADCENTIHYVVPFEWLWDKSLFKVYFQK